MNKREIAKIFREIGILLELKGENPFKARAYEKAARIIEMLDGDIEVLVKEKRLGGIKGIGKALEKKIEELVTTGRLDYYETLKSSFPETLFELLKLPGLGPKKIRILYEKLGIATLEELEHACQENRLIALPGFGKKIQQNIIKGIAYIKRYQQKFLFSEAFSTGNAILEELKQQPDVVQIDLAGSLRRRKELIKDIDILVSSNYPEKVMEYFVKLSCVEEIIVRKREKSSIKIENGMVVDLRIVSCVEYPYALYYFTGSREHVAAMQDLAKGMKMKINEYGLFNEDTHQRIVCKNEEEIFDALDMEYIPPELRENMGEIEAAMGKKLPELVKETDIKGVFHVHTNYSDGFNSLEELAQEARRLGYQYMGVSDHSRSAYYANGLSLDDIKRQHSEIDALNEKYEGFKILKGIESDILPDGKLDYPDDVLAGFDFVIASVHTRFSMSREEMTKRILKALDNPHVTILGHPTGRLLLSREGYSIDMEKILTKAAERGIIIEINSNPYRLDLDWRWCRMAKELGVKIAICPDAHDLQGFRHVFYGVGIARKGWLEKKDVINCLDLHSIEKYLRVNKRK